MNISSDFLDNDWECSPLFPQQAGCREALNGREDLFNEVNRRTANWYRSEVRTWAANFGALTTYHVTWRQQMPWRPRSKIYPYQMQKCMKIEIIAPFSLNTTRNNFDDAGEFRRMKTVPQPRKK